MTYGGPVDACYSGRVLGEQNDHALAFFMPSHNQMDILRTRPVACLESSHDLVPSPFAPDMASQNRLVRGQSEGFDRELGLLGSGSDSGVPSTLQADWKPKATFCRSLANIPNQAAREREHGGGF